MITYYIPYFLIVPMIALYDKHLVKHNPNRNVCFFFATISFVLVGFRAFTVGKDTREYYFLFDYLKNGGSMFNELISYEPGFYVYTKICSMLFPHAGWYLLLTAFLTYFLFALYFSKESSYPLLSCAIFFGLFYVQTYNLMREMLSVSIGIISILYIKEHKIIKSIILMSLAALLHTAGLLSFVFLIIILPNKKKLIRYTAIGSIIVITLKEPLFMVIANIFPKYRHYVLNLGYNILFLSEGSFSSWFKTGIYMTIAIVCFMIARRNGEDSYYINCFFMILATLFSFLGNNMMMFHRLVFFFGVVICVAVPSIIIDYFPRNRISISIVIYILMGILLYLSINAGNNIETPYSTWII